MINVIMMDMKSNSKGKNLIGEEEEKVSPSPQKTAHSVEEFLNEMGISSERKGRAIYVYADSIQQLKQIMEKMPLPQEGEYVIIPLGQSNGYSVFIMVTIRSTSIRIGYGRNSIPFSFSLAQIMGKLEKVAKEIGIQSIKNTKNLIEA